MQLYNFQSCQPTRYLISFKLASIKKIQDERIHSRYKIIRSCLFDPGDGRVPERLAPQKVKTDVKDYREFEN